MDCDIFKISNFIFMWEKQEKHFTEHISIHGNEHIYSNKNKAIISLDAQMYTNKCTGH